MAIKANLVIDQGKTYSTDLNLTDENGDALVLSGYSANSQIRKHYTSSNSVSFTTSINANAGIITLSLTANQTANLTGGRYVYDILVSSGTTVYRLASGNILVIPGISSAP